MLGAFSFSGSFAPLRNFFTLGVLFVTSGGASGRPRSKASSTKFHQKSELSSNSSNKTNLLDSWKTGETCRTRTKQLGGKWRQGVKRLEDEGRCEDQTDQVSKGGQKTDLGTGGRTKITRVQNIIKTTTMPSGEQAKQENKETPTPVLFIVCTWISLSLDHGKQT